MSLKDFWEGFTGIFKNGWEEISGIENQWANEDPRILLSVVIGIVVAVISVMITSRKIANRKKKKEIAIERGNVIKAKRVQVYRDYDTDENTGTREVINHGVYEYTVDGKTKRYRVQSRGGLPYVFLYLYYTDSPRKVFSDYDNPQLGFSVAILLGIAACLLAMFLTGYIL